MKIRSQILLLLLAVVAIFLGGLSLIKQEEDRRVAKLTEESAIYLNGSFDHFVRERERALEQFVSPGFHNWNGVLHAAQQGDAAALSGLLGPGVLHTYDANAAWILRPDLTLLFATNNIAVPDLNQPGFLSTLQPAVAARSPQGCHYFAWTPEGLLEVRCTPLQPAGADAKTAKPAGYFLAGRLWTDRDVQELGAISDNQVNILQAHAAVRTRDRADVINFERELNGPGGEPVAWLHVRHSSGLIGTFETEADELALWLVAFCVVLLVMMAAALHLLVSKPLQKMTHAMHQRDPSSLGSLRKRRSEIGELAGLIADFHAQRDELVTQMDGRRTAQRALEDSREQLRHAQKMEAVGRLAGGISHDFNNLLTAILGYANLLADGFPEDSEEHRHASTILQAGDQAAALTQQLLAFSRKQLLQPRVIDLNELVRELERLLRRILGEHIEIHTEYSAMPGTIKADRHQIEQVVLNLAVNARDAMPRGGILMLKTVNKHVMDNEIPDLAAGEFVALQVSDTGHGMDAATLERIFEPFFTTKTAGKGTGLGLATVYGVVKQSGGGVQVESEPGHGTMFRILFPKSTEPVFKPAPFPGLLEPASEGGTILVVDDEIMVSGLVSDVLKQQGYNVLAAGSASQAIGLSREHDVDLLITDVVMPRIDGRALSEIVEARHHRLKTLYVSGYAENAPAGEETILPEDAMVLSKPFTPECLTRKVRELLGTC